MHWYKHRTEEKKDMLKIWENRDIKYVTTKARRNYLVSKPSYHKIWKNVNVNE